MLVRSTQKKELLAHVEQEITPKHAHVTDRNGRDCREKGRALGATREERKEKREEKYNHNQDERAEEGNSGARREEERVTI